MNKRVSEVSKVLEPVIGNSKIAAITRSTYGKTQYLNIYTTLQRKCFDLSLIFWANEHNGSGVCNVMCDMYVLRFTVAGGQSTRLQR